MNYFKEMNLKNYKEVIVLGEKENSKFVEELKDFLGRDCAVLVPDNKCGKLILHTKEFIDKYSKSSYQIGVLDINIMEKRICDAVDGYEIFCSLNDTENDELIYPKSIAKAVMENENYDVLFIDNVDSEAKRYLARELAKFINNGTSVRMIDTDSNYTEILIK